MDDGSRSLAETLRYLREFRAQGVATLVFTPHLLVPRLQREEIGEVLERQRERFAWVLQQTIGDTSIPSLHLAQEILARGPADLDPILERTDLGIGAEQALLVEFGFEPGFDAEGVIRRAVGAGRTILVAHPERYRFAGEEEGLDHARRWHDLGAILQVNGGSLAGLYSEPANRLGQRLLREGLVGLVSSDHHGDHRPHPPEIVLEAIRRDAGPEEAERLMSGGHRLTFTST